MSDKKPGAEEVEGRIADLKRLNGVLDQDEATKHPSTNEDQYKLHGNKNSISFEEYSTAGTTAEQLDSYSVQEGVEVLVVPLPSNSGDVYLGDSSIQPYNLTAQGGLYFSITDTDLLYIQTPTSGDGVIMIWEG